MDNIIFFTMICLAYIFMFGCIIAIGMLIINEIDNHFEKKRKELKEKNKIMNYIRRHK